MAKANFPLKKRIELVEQCFEFIGTGQPVGRFADSIGIPRTTLYGWLRRYSRMVNRNYKSMVPITHHATLPEKPVAACTKMTGPSDNAPVCIDLGYCKIDIPTGCN